MSHHTIILFDIDGTLSLPRKQAKSKVIELLQTYRDRVYIGVVGGSDFEKQKEQLGDNVLNDFDYCFAENGLVAYNNGNLIGKQCIQEFLGEENIKKIINWALLYISQLDLPIKRGTFVEFRTGMLNISPIGRNCSRSERNDFEKYDFEHGIRNQMVKLMQEEFSDLNLTYSIGGQISFDVFPKGWDKTFCLKYLNDVYETIHFFGDKTFEGGNDYEIYNDPRVIGHTVTDPEDTMRQLKALMLQI